MPEAAAALRKLEDALKDLHIAWNTAEGRRGKISENRAVLNREQEELDEQREQLRQEQWKLRKESATLQHARDEVDSLQKLVSDLTAERDETRIQVRAILAKTKTLRAGLQS
jgi:chromosome segregation ATPase